VAGPDAQHPELPVPAARFHELLFTAHPDPLFVMDPGGAFLAANPAFEALLGYSLADLRAMTYAPFVAEQDAARVDEHFAAAVAGETRQYETTGIDRTGRSFDVHVTNTPVRDATGQVVAVLGIARDVSAKRAALAALEQSEQRFRGLFEGAGFGIAITDLDGRFVDANPTFVRLVGRSVDDLRGRDLLELTHPEDRAATRDHLSSVLAGDVSSAVLEKRHLATSGADVWVRASLALIRDEAGQPSHLTTTIEDITASRLAQERLQRSERLQGLAGRLALVGGWAVDAHDLTVYWSPEIYRILDVPDGEEPPLEDAVGMYPTEHRERIDAALQACLTEGVPFDLELEVNTQTGRRIPVRAVGEAERGEDGQILRVVGAFQDVTEVRRATVLAQEAADRLALALESMTDAFFTLDRDWRFTFVNRRAGELLQRDPLELLGRVIWEEYPDAVGSVVFDAYHAAMDGQGTQAVGEYHYPPLAAWFSITAYPSDHGVSVYFQDITAQRELRIEREAQEAVLRRQAALLDEAQDAIIVRDLDHRVTFWNASAERIYGWSSEEAIGSDVRDLLYESTEAFETATAEVLANESWSGHLTQRTRAGELVVVSGRWSLIRDDDGNPNTILAINTDITEQQRIEQQLLRAQRMESIGTLASGVAHDLNNVLSPILLAAELLQLDDRTPEEAEQLSTIVSSARRGSDLVTQVLSFARGVDGQRSPIAIRSILEDVYAIVRDTFPKNIAVETDYPSELPTIVGDSTQIHQVLLNLAVNARDAMPNGGTLCIRASTVDLDDQYLVGAVHTVAGPYLRIEVEDTGSGMLPEVRDRIFEPFFTTKPQGAGTGLGLSTSAAIVQSHGGLVHVYSEPGQGSRFRVYLPTAETSTEPVEPVSATLLPRGSGQTILVVDDEAAVRSMTRQTLEAFGYKVVEAANGAEAVSRYARAPEEIALVLTDMMMPIMDGPATIHALQDLDPSVLIIGSSGLHGNGKVAQASASGVTHFIPKPYTTEKLLRTVAEALDSGGRPGAR
jgi:two-component system, cell cycle sensor histidine kinase and response regulator CckA